MLAKAAPIHLMIPADDVPSFVCGYVVHDSEDTPPWSAYYYATHSISYLHDFAHHYRSVIEQWCAGERNGWHQHPQLPHVWLHDVHLVDMDLSVPDTIPTDWSAP